MAQLNKTPMVIRLSVGTDANIIKATAYGWEGEPAFATDTGALFVFESTEGVPLRFWGAQKPIVTKSATYAVAVTDYTILVDTDGGAVTIDLLPAANAYVSEVSSGQIFVVKNIGTSGNDVTIDGDSSETIDGATTKALTDGQSAIIQSDGTGWHTIGGV